MQINLKSFYAYYRSNAKVKETVAPLVNSDGMKVSDHEEMCVIF